MARTEARMKCEIWDDEDYRSLTLEAQWLYQALLTQKDLSLCGVLTWTPKRFAKLASNASANTARKALTLLRDRRYVVVDEDTDELWVRTLITNDRVLDNHNSLIGMSRAFGAIHSNPIRKALVEGLPKGVLEGLPKGVTDRLAMPLVDALALAGARPPPHPPSSPASCLLPPASCLPSLADEPPTPERRSGSKRAAGPPDDFALTDELRAWAADNVPRQDLNLEAETAKFLDHHRAKGSTFKDWEAAWRTWMRRSGDYAPRPNGAPPDDVDTEVAAYLKRHTMPSELGR